MLHGILSDRHTPADKISQVFQIGMNKCSRSMERSAITESFSSRPAAGSQEDEPSPTCSATRQDRLELARIMIKSYLHISSQDAISSQVKIGDPQKAPSSGNLWSLRKTPVLHGRRPSQALRFTAEDLSSTHTPPR